jgi:PAS domain S-box-containing protein
MLKKIKKIFDLIIGDEESYSLENRLFLSTVVIGIAVSVLGFMISLIVSSSPVTLLAALFTFIVLIIFYYFIRIKRIFTPFVIPVIVISFLAISVIWIFDGGINGSDIMVGFVILILALIIVPAKARKFVISLFITLIIIIYYIQLYRPELITGFASEKVRWTDSIITAVYSSIFIFLIIGFLLKNYTIEKQRAEENEIMFRALSENSQDIIARFDRQHQHTYINKAGIETMGVTADKIIGKTPGETGVYNNQQSELFKNTIEKVFTTGQPQFEQYSQDIDKGHSYYDLRLFPEFNDKNEVMSVLGVSRDISNLKQSEIKLLKLNADKDLFISILAHDLRNPFNSILGLSEIMLEDIESLDKATVKNHIGIIHTISEKTFSLLEDLLLWTRAQSGKLEYKPEMMDFVTTCLGTIETIRMNAISKNITINFSATGHINLIADPDMLKVVIRNLVSNAIKFTKPGGHIEIEAGLTESELLVVVSDNGVGINQSRIKNLFDISKIETTSGTSNEKGTGLGLLLCKEFVEKHGGRIWVESTEGKGSQFKFTLPVMVI